MGIKFQCPNCGKGLNVKSNLAGKRGLCPHCRGRVLIPAESDAVAPANAVVPANAVAPAKAVTPANAVVPAKAGQVAEPKRPESAPGRVPVPARDVRSSSTVAPQVFENLSFENLAVEELDANSFRLDRPQVELEAPRATHFDWIADAPESVWYVRNRAGGQYGPAVGSIMRTWLQEGRVSRDCYVWREGWANWRQANDVFPHLFEPRTHGLPPQLAATANAANPPDESRSATRSLSESAAAGRRAETVEPSTRQRNSTGLFVAILLLVLTVSSVAIGTLVYFLPRSAPVSPTPSDDDPLQLRDPFAE